MNTKPLIYRKPLLRAVLASIFLGFLATASLPSALAANAMWNGTTNGVWATTTNWNPVGVPGDGNTATFNNAGNANTTLDLGAGVTVKLITFDTASAAAYTIGSGAVGSQKLALNPLAVITMNSTVVANETFNANILIGTDATYSYASFYNNSTTNNLILAGGISGNTGGTAAGKSVAFNGVAGSTTIVSGAISNGGATTMGVQVYSGKTILSGTNTYTGLTTANAVLQFANEASLYGGTTTSWTAANMTVNNGGTLAFNVGGTGEFTSSDLDTLQTNLKTTINNNGFKAGSVMGLDTTNATGGSFTYNTAITNSTGTGAGAVGLAKLGAGTLVLGGANTYSGATKIQEGTLKIGSTSALGLYYNTVSVTAGAVLDLNGTTIPVGCYALTLNGAGISSGGALINSSATAGTYSGLITLGSASSIIAGSGNITVSATGTISGAYGLTLGGAQNGSIASIIGTGTGTLTKQDAGKWTLSGTNTYSGKTIVQNGTLSFSEGNATATANQQLGANATLDLGVASTSSGTLLYTGAAGTLAKAINALGNGTDTIQNSGTGLLTLTGLLTKNGTVLTLKGGTYGITVSGAGTIAGSNSGSDLIVDGGTTTLATANTYNGPTSIINGATLNANITNALPTTNGRTAVSIDPSGSGTSTLALGASQSILSLTGASTSKVSLGANTLTVGTTGGSTTFAGVISGTLGNLVKDGASTQVFSGNNTYTGTTTVSTGTLLISGDQSAATGNVSVSNTATLGGSGKTGGAVTVQNGGFLAPGNNTTGILKVASLALNSTSTTQFEINGTGAPGTNYDQIVVNAGGALALNGAFTIAFGSSLANSSSINLFSFTAGHSGDFTSLVSTGSYAGTWTPSGAVGSEIFTFNTGPQLLTFSEATGNLTVVPEPATWALLAFSLTTVMVMRRRRNNHG